MSKRRRSNSITRIQPRVSPPQTRGAVALAGENNIGGSPYPGNMGPNAGHLPVNMATTSTTQPALSLQWPNQTPSGHPYPDMGDVALPKPDLANLGATGTAIFSGIITSEEYNPDFYWRDGIKIYEQMMRNDAQIFAVRQLMELPIRRATWSIEPFSDSAQDKEIASFVDSCLFHDMCYQTADGGVIYQTWDDLLRQMLMAISYGFMAFEKVFRIEDGWVKWARWTPLLPRTVWRWWVGSDNELTGIQQWTFKNYSYQFVNIPAGKLLLFVHRQEGNNYEGVSVLRTAYKNWWYKQNFEKIDAISIERNAVVPPVIYLPENATSNDLQAAQTIVQNIRANEMGGVTLPHDFNLEFPKNMQKYAAAIMPSIQYHDIMIARNVLAQFVNLGSTETGAYALDASQKSTFLSALQAECEWIEDTINANAIKQLVDYNFDGVEGYPKIKCSKVLADDFDKISTALQILGGAGFIHPTPETEDMLRDMLGLPSAPLSEIEATNPTAPSTPDRPDTQPGNHSDQAPVNKNGVAGDSAPAQAAAALSVVEETRLLREALEAVMV